MRKDSGEDLSDDAVASMVRMLCRSDLNHELVCVMGRDRILSLSQQCLRLEDALCTAICIIRNCAGIADIHCQKSGDNLRRWANELIEESKLDFDAALSRVNDKEGDEE